jgi:hypothetical protein
MTGSKTSAPRLAAYALNGVPQAPSNTCKPSRLRYRARLDYSAPVALDPTATAVELANWRLEMQMNFAYTTAQSALATAILDSVGQPGRAQSGAPSHAFTFSFVAGNGRRNVPETCGPHRP